MTDMNIYMYETVNWAINGLSTQMAKTLGSRSIRYQSNVKVSDRCLINVDPMVLDLVNGLLPVVWHQAVTFTNNDLHG